MRTHILGIDPGVCGALALYSCAEEITLEVFDMPIHHVRVGGKRRRQLDLYELARWVDIHAPSTRCAVIEAVHAMPRQGVASSFSFGFSAGAVQGIVAANFIPMILVTPSTWKRALGIGANKDDARRKASQLLPKFCQLWSRTQDHGRAEAALLAGVWGPAVPTLIGPAAETVTTEAVEP